MSLNLSFLFPSFLTGRAIRHKDDYATILLLDQRYARPSVQSKLPAWIQTRMQTMSRFGPAFAMMSKVRVIILFYFITHRTAQ